MTDIDVNADVKAGVQVDIKAMALASLEDLKAQDIVVMDVKQKTTVTDWVIVASGTSSRHVKSIASSVNVDAKKAGLKPYGIEGNETGEWVLVDLGSVVVHVMQKEVRKFYDLESLWKMDTSHREESEG